MSVDIADRYREAIDTALLYELFGFVRVRHLADQRFTRPILLSLYPAELRLYADPSCVGSAHRFEGKGEVLFEGQLRAIGHDGVDAALGGVLDRGEVRDVIQL